MPARPEPVRLWAPWRMSYIEEATATAKRRRVGGRSTATREAETPCLFCRVATAKRDRADLVLARRPQAVLMLNRYPYNPGHLMVAVLAHKAQFTELSSGERSDLLDLVALAERALGAEYRPHGVNYGANVGRVAGAGFPGHLHVHLVPRWDGDTNFMPVVGHTKVLPESLDQTWTRLRRAARAHARSAGKRRGQA